MSLLVYGKMDYQTFFEAVFAKSEDDQKKMANIIKKIRSVDAGKVLVERLNPFLKMQFS